MSEVGQRIVCDCVPIHQAGCAVMGDIARTRSLEKRHFWGLPAKEMIDRGWIFAESVDDTEQVKHELIRFFEVENASELEALLPSHAADIEKTHG